MKKLIYMMAFLALASQLTNCKKDDKDDDDDNSSTATVLCDGKGGSTWLRLDSTNSWTYDYSAAGINIQPVTLLAGTTTIEDGLTYRVVTDEDGGYMLFTDYYYREDATTHDIYRYYDLYDEEYLEIPGSPTLDQSWPTFINYSRKVTGVDASVSTGSCNYTGLLEITEFNGNMEAINIFYYKKGLGLVKLIRQYQGDEHVFVLKAVSLK